MPDLELDDIKWKSIRDWQDKVEKEGLDYTDLSAGDDKYELLTIIHKGSYSSAFILEDATAEIISVDGREYKLKITNNGNSRTISLKGYNDSGKLKSSFPDDLVMGNASSGYLLKKGLRGGARKNKSRKNKRKNKKRGSRRH